MVRESIRRTLLLEAEALRLMAENVTDEAVQAVDWIVSCTGRVITCGVGKSGHIAKKTSGTLSSTGTPSLFLHAAEAVHGDLGMVTSNDIVLLYSFSGETDEIVRLFPSIRSIGARTILITGRSHSSAGREADLCLTVPVTEEACPNNLAPTTSTTAMLALSDALALAAMERRGFSREDFARFHPSGALGKRLLLTVRDIMRSGDDLAIVTPEASAVEVMRAIGRAGAGGACVIDRDELLGFISDGDLRRHFVGSDNPFEARAIQIMTPNPSTIEADLLAAEALEAFQNLTKKIGDMPVVDGGRVVGMLVMKDLLRSGII